MKFVLIGFSSACKELEESLIFIFSSFSFGFSPKRFYDIDCLSVNGYWEVDKIRIFLDNLLYISLL